MFDKPNTIRVGIKYAKYRSSATVPGRSQAYAYSAEPESNWSSPEETTSLRYRLLGSPTCYTELNGICEFSSGFWRKILDLGSKILCV